RTHRAVLWRRRRRIRGGAPVAGHPRAVRAARVRPDRVVVAGLDIRPARLASRTGGARPQPTDGVVSDRHVLAGRIRHLPRRRHALRPRPQLRRQRAGRVGGGGRPRRLDPGRQRTYPAGSREGQGCGRTRIRVNGNTSRKLYALSLAGGLLAWSAGPGRRHPIVQPLLATALVAITKAPLGFRPPALWVGLRVGSIAASVVAVAVA